MAIHVSHYELPTLVTLFTATEEWQAVCCYNTSQVTEERRNLWPSWLRTRGTDGLLVCLSLRWRWMLVFSAQGQPSYFVNRYVCALLGPHRQVVRVRVMQAEA
jgi:hypothetical protein